MTDSEISGLDVFIQEIIKSQSRVRAYILAALGNHADADDVLQRTNLVLWKKAKEFRPGAEFVPWALGIARYEVLSFLRSRRRERHVFSADVAMLMLDAAADEIATPGDRQMAPCDVPRKIARCGVAICFGSATIRKSRSNKSRAKPGELTIR